MKYSGSLSSTNALLLMLVAIIMTTTTTTTILSTTQAFVVPHSALRRSAAAAAAAPPTSFVSTQPTTTTTTRTATMTTTTTRTTTTWHRMMLDPASGCASMDMLTSIPTSFDTTSTATTATFSSDMLLAFTDQGQNLAGTFFQASLLPYLLFLYFLSFRGNRLTDTANFGFQFVLLFVLSTIPSGIISKSIYGVSLANVDWLHGFAESLLTAANVLIVLGLSQAITNPNPPDNQKIRNFCLGLFAAFAVTAAIFPKIIMEPHTPFALGLGDLPNNLVMALPWIKHTEPVNALSIPTWAIHFSSVLEYVFAMNLIWKYADITQNPKWKGLTWGMLPLHASGLCACTYHFFYNPPELQFLVTSQAGLTFLGNITLLIATFRIARSNGWSVDEINPFPKSATSPVGLVADGIAAQPLQTIDDDSLQNTSLLTAKLVGLTLLLSYGIKYGELGLDLPFTPNPIAATAMIVGIPSVTAYYYYNLSQKEDSSEEEEAGGFRLPALFGGGDKEGGPSLSMEDVKKYGVAGTVAYVLTELAFWLVAFPVAATALYQSTGHWPDVINDNTDRAAVLAFIFAGANIARAFVPIRLGAALALAPWVDENLLSRFGGDNADSKQESSSSSLSQSSEQS